MIYHSGTMLIDLYGGCGFPYCMCSRGTYCLDPSYMTKCIIAEYRG